MEFKAFLSSIFTYIFIGSVAANIDRFDFVKLPADYLINDIIQAPLPSTDVFVTGAFNNRGFIRKYDGNGATLLWERFYGNGTTSFTKLAVSTFKDTIFALGSTTSRFNEYQLATGAASNALIVQLDRANGTTLGYRSWGIDNTLNAALLAYVADGYLMVLYRTDDKLAVRKVSTRPVRANQLDDSLFTGTNNPLNVAGMTAALFKPSSDTQFVVVGSTPNAVGLSGSPSGGKDFFYAESQYGSINTAQLNGTTADDIALGSVISTDSKRYFIAGYSEGSFAPATNVGRKDVVIYSQTMDLKESWIKQFGTAGDDYAMSVAYNKTEILVSGSQNSKGFVSRLAESTGSIIETITFEEYQEITKIVGENSANGTKPFLLALVKDSAGVQSIVKLVVSAPPKPNFQIKDLFVDKSLVIIAATVVPIVVCCCGGLAGLAFWLHRRIQRNKAKAFGAGKNLMEDAGPPTTISASSV